MLLFWTWIKRFNAYSVGQCVQIYDSLQTCSGLNAEIHSLIHVRKTRHIYLIFFYSPWFYVECVNYTYYFIYVTGSWNKRSHRRYKKPLWSRHKRNLFSETSWKNTFSKEFASLTNYHKSCANLFTYILHILTTSTMVVNMCRQKVQAEKRGISS